MNCKVRCSNLSEKIHTWVDKVLKKWEAIIKLITLNGIFANKTSNYIKMDMLIKNWGDIIYDATFINRSKV